MHMDIFFIFLKKHALYRTMRAEVIIIIIIVIIIIMPVATGGMPP